MKRTLSLILVFMLLACLGLSIAFAEPVIVPESSGTPASSGSGGTSSGSNYSDSSIVIVDPDTKKPVETPQPAVTYYVPDTPPVITKNPSGESIEAGESVVFVARANDATNIQWFLTNGTTTILAQEVGVNFPGVTAAGVNSERLVLSNVSDKLDGWSAMARFDNDIGSTWSAQAKLTVAPDPNAVPSPTPTPLPTPTPAPTPTPVPANVYVGNATGGTATQHGTGGDGITTNPSTVGNSNTTAIGNTSGTDIATTTGIATTGTAGTGSAGTGRNNHIGAYVLAGLAGLVIIGSILVMALYMKGKISLGKFEKFLGSFGNDNDANMLDNSGEFYNPDDFKEKDEVKDKKAKK